MDKDQENYQKFFEILELDDDASLAEINRAYKKLKELYSSVSMVTDPIEDEFSGEQRREIVIQLDEAYKCLVSYVVEKDRTQKAPPLKKELEDTGKEIKEEAVNAAGPPDDLPEDLDESLYIHENKPEDDYVHIELSESDRVDPGVVQKNAFTVISTGDGYDEDNGEFDTHPFDASKIEVKEVKKDIPDEDTADKDLDKRLAIIKDNYENTRVKQKLESALENIPIKGRTMRKIREKLGKGVHEIALASNIHYKILVNIEKERFNKLPEPGYLRWCVTTYAKALCLDPKKAADEYMTRFRQWDREQEENKKKNK
jgi:hypothetical protein